MRIEYYLDDELIDSKLFTHWYIKVKNFSYKIQIKYNINAQNFMIVEHAVYVFSNMNFGFKVVKT